MTECYRIVRNYAISATNASEKYINIVNNEYHYVYQCGWNTKVRISVANQIDIFSAKFVNCGCGYTRLDSLYPLVLFYHDGYRNIKNRFYIHFMEDNYYLVNHVRHNINNVENYFICDNIEGIFNLIENKLYEI